MRHPIDSLPIIPRSIMTSRHYDMQTFEPWHFGGLIHTEQMVIMMMTLTCYSVPPSCWSLQVMMDTSTPRL